MSRTSRILSSPRFPAATARPWWRRPRTARCASTSACRATARQCSSRTDRRRIFQMPDARPIVFETDFGLGNEWVGICHAVMSRIAPSSRIIDLSHLVRPLDVSGGARLLADSLPYLPEDAILIAVVDPNVGADRDVALQAED